MELTPELIAYMDFRPVPAAERRSPGRVKSVPARLYVDKYQEHREAFVFIQSQQNLHGEGSRTLVKALLHFRDTVVRPLEELQRRPQRRNQQQMPPEVLLRAQLAFRPLPEAQRANPGRVKHVSARLYIDKYIEHREAFDFIQSQQELHGEGLKTLVRALLHYRDTVIRPLIKDPVDTGKPQLSLDVS